MFHLDYPLSISSKVNLDTELWKAATASCVRMGFLPLSPTTLMEDLPTNLVVHLIADLPRLLIALCQGHSTPSVPSAKVAIIGIANYPRKG